jgi:hypothetical protein
VRCPGAAWPRCAVAAPTLNQPRSEDIDCGETAMTAPTFVVIGAMMAGTVSLCHYLDEHPAGASGLR